MAGLRILQISSQTQGVSMYPPPLPEGQDGAVISEVVNLWRSSWEVGKGVNDLDWGAGGGSCATPELILTAFSNKIVTVSPSGNFLIFDVSRGRLGRSHGLCGGELMNRREGSQRRSSATSERRQTRPTTVSWSYGPYRRDRGSSEALGMDFLLATLMTR